MFILLAHDVFYDLGITDEPHTPEHNGPADKKKQRLREGAAL
jgi:hypothetical protein